MLSLNFISNTIVTQKQTGFDFIVNTEQDLHTLQFVFQSYRPDEVNKLKIGDTFKMNDLELERWRKEKHFESKFKIANLTSAANKLTSLKDRPEMALDPLSMLLASKMKSQVESNLQKLINQLKTEQRFVNFLNNDFGLNLIKNDWTREPVHSDFADTQKLKKLIKLYKAYPDPSKRMMSDFKEVVELVKKLPWFVALGRHYKDEDALEIVRFAKIR